MRESQDPSHNFDHNWVFAVRMGAASTNLTAMKRCASSGKGVDEAEDKRLGFAILRWPLWPL